MKTKLLILLGLLPLAALATDKKISELALTNAVAAGDLVVVNTTNSVTGLQRTTTIPLSSFLTSLTNLANWPAGGGGGGGTWGSITGTLASQTDLATALADTTNTARLTTQLGGSFDPLGRATETTNTARLTTQLANSFLSKDFTGYADTYLFYNNAGGLDLLPQSTFDFAGTAQGATNTARMVTQITAGFGNITTNNQTLSGFLEGNGARGVTPTSYDVVTNNRSAATVFSNTVAIRSGTEGMLHLDDATFSKFFQFRISASQPSNVVVTAWSNARPGIVYTRQLNGNTNQLETVTNGTAGQVLTTTDTGGFAWSNAPATSYTPIQLQSVGAISAAATYYIGSAFGLGPNGNQNRYPVSAGYDCTLRIMNMTIGASAAGSGGQTLTFTVWTNNAAAGNSWVVPANGPFPYITNITMAHPLLASDKIEVKLVTSASGMPTTPSFHVRLLTQ